MIHYSTTFCCTHPDLSLSIFLYFLCFRNIYSSFSSVRILPKHLHFSFATLSILPSPCRPPSLKKKMSLPLPPTSQKYTVLKPPSFTQWHINFPWKSIKTRLRQKPYRFFQSFVQHLQSQDKKRSPSNNILVFI